MFGRIHLLRVPQPLVLEGHLSTEMSVVSFVCFIWEPDLALFTNPFRLTVDRNSMFYQDVRKLVV